MSRFAPRCKQFKCENCVLQTAQKRELNENMKMERCNETWKETTEIKEDFYMNIMLLLKQIEIKINCFFLSLLFAVKYFLLFQSSPVNGVKVKRCTPQRRKWNDEVRNFQLTKRCESFFAKVSEEKLTRKSRLRFDL